MSVTSIGGLETVYSYSQMSLRNTSAQSGLAQAGQGETASSSDLVTISSLLAETNSDNLMSRNYADADSEQSKYLSAQLQSRRSENNIKNKMDSLVGVLASGVKTVSKYTDGVLIKTRAERAIRDAHAPDLQEDFEKYLEGSQERLEQEAREALGVQEGGGETAAASQQAAPLPDASGSASAEQGDSSQAETEAEAALPPSPAEVASIDLTV